MVKIARAIFELTLLFHPKCISFNPKKKLPPCRFSPRASRVKGAATLPRALCFSMLAKSTCILDRHQRMSIPAYVYYNNQLQVVNEMDHHDAMSLTQHLRNTYTSIILLHHHHLFTYEYILLFTLSPLTHIFPRVTMLGSFPSTCFPHTHSQRIGSWVVYQL